MHWLPQDLRYAVRQLRKSPGFTLVAVLTLALGIGANTAIASAVYAILLRSLPFHDAGRLVLIKETHPHAGIISTPATSRTSSIGAHPVKSFENLAAYSDEHHNFAQLVIDGQPQSVRDAFATADLFPALGIQPELGRGFLPTEDSDAGIHVAVISHPLWESRFARDPSIIGRAVQVNGQSFTVAGMMPAGRQYPVDTDLWLPFSQLGQDERTSRQYHVVDVIGRLRPGVSREDAAVELNTIAARLAQTYPATNRTIGVRLTPLRDALVGQLRPTLLALFGSVALVLFIACANIANLLLVRATHREREIALRMALGASRGRLLRQFLVESLVLSFVGAASGIALAAAAMPLLSFGLAHVSNQPFAFAQPISLNLPVLVFTVLLAVATGVTLPACFPR